MFEIADRLIAAHERGAALAVATAVSIVGSAPRTVGTSMAFDGETVIGSIAGGCVEGAVVELCELVLADGRPRTVEYGISDDLAFSAGLTCGGTLRIHVQPVTESLAASLRDGVPIAFDCTDGDEPFVDVPVVRPHLIIFGAMEFSAALAAAADLVGYRVTVCDPRSLFATQARFPSAELVVHWPVDFLADAAVDERTAVCVLSHDQRFDAELIALALSLDVEYVGAMGSRTTHDRRVESLRERGVTDEALARLHSPIGLDLGASSPAETAISILAEIMAARTGSTAAPLTTTHGSIHRLRVSQLPEPVA